VTAATDRFWLECRRELAAETEGRVYRVKRFGDDPAMSRLLLDLIRSRAKTGTFAVDWEFDAAPAGRPRPGDLFIVVDADGEPGALIRITETRVLPFADVGPVEVACEGPALRDVALWRRVHWDYWSRTLQGIGRQPSEDMPILFQRFEVLR